MMRFWLICSWFDTLTLMKFLHRYDHQYNIVRDFALHNYGSHSPQLVLDRAISHIDRLVERGISKIFVSPLIELLIKQHHPYHYNFLVPIFEQYVKRCFEHSLIGKIGIIGEYADSIEAQRTLHNLEKTYHQTEFQSKTKKFSWPFAYRFKKIDLWQWFFGTWGQRSMIINTLVKLDLRYLKDAFVDTIVPFNYGFFLYEKTIKRFIKSKQQFHGIDILEQIFVSMTKEHKSDKYGVTIFYTDHAEQLKQARRRVRLLQRGKTIQLTYENW